MQARHLIALITTRDDWARDSVSVGQEELQRLWSVSHHTMIRDLTQLRQLGVPNLVETGRWGRVALYRFGHCQLDALLGPTAEHVGHGLAQQFGQADPGVGEPARAGGDPIWTDLRHAVATEIGQAAAARWLERPRSYGISDGAIRLTAPSQFHAEYVARGHRSAVGGWRPVLMGWMPATDGIALRQAGGCEVTRKGRGHPLTMLASSRSIWRSGFSVCMVRGQTVRSRSADKRHLDDVVIAINSEPRRLWRAVDAEGDVLDILVQKRRNARAGKRFLAQLIDRFGQPRVVVMDKLRSYIKPTGA